MTILPIRIKTFFSPKTKKPLILIGGAAAFVFIAAVLIPLSSFAAADDTASSITRAVANVVGGIVSLYIKAIGGLLFLLVQALLFVASFNNFVSSVAVTKGWVIVRDVCNMFFVLILLIIAIGTILQQEKYHWQKLLPKFIAAAILINFSKVICGVIIDFSQVIMLTFVAAFSEGGGGNFFAALGIPKLLSAVKNVDDLNVNVMAVVTSLILAAIFVTIAVVVMGIMVMILVIRIVALWFLVVLSPLAFTLQILPDSEKTGEKWWTQFSNYVVVGPAMAFFLWLSLAVVQSVATASGKNKAQDIGLGGEITKHRAIGREEEKGPGALLEEKEASAIGLSEIATLEGTLGYLLGIGMLVGSLMAAQEMGVAGSDIAKKGLGLIKDYTVGAKNPLARPLVDTWQARNKMKEQQRGIKAQSRAQRLLGIEAAVKQAPGRVVGGALRAAAVPAALGWASEKLGIQKFHQTMAKQKSNLVDGAQKDREDAAKERAKGTFAGNYAADQLENKANLKEFGAGVTDFADKMPKVAWEATKMTAALAVAGGQFGLTGVVGNTLGYATLGTFLESSGKADALTASTFERQEAQKAKDGLKGMRRDQVVAIAQGTLQGPTASERFNKMGAILEILDKGYLDNAAPIAPQIEALRQQYTAMSGTDAGKHAFEAAAMQYAPNAESQFKTEADVIAGISGGTIEIKELKVQALTAGVVDAIFDAPNVADHESFMKSRVNREAVAKLSGGRLAAMGGGAGYAGMAAPDQETYRNTARQHAVSHADKNIAYNTAYGIDAATGNFADADRRQAFNDSIANTPVGNRLRSHVISNINVSALQGPALADVTAAIQAGGANALRNLRSTARSGGSAQKVTVDFIVDQMAAPGAVPAGPLADAIVNARARPLS